MFRQILIVVGIAAVACLAVRGDAQHYSPVPMEYPGAVEPIDLDAWLAHQEMPNFGGCGACSMCQPDFRQPWSLQVVPDGLIYKSYLAGPREPRLSATGSRIVGENGIWEGMLGARVGLLRYGSCGTGCVQGFQIDVEGGALARLDSSRDLVATDYRFGIPLTFAMGNYQTKLAYYHVSSHLGDEFIINNTAAARINYVRDAIVWGHSFYLDDAIRVYGEIGYAFNTDGGAEPWEFQFGGEYSPRYCTGPRGAPFFAANAHLREEVNFGGDLTVQAGWQWRGKTDGALLRAGLQYYNGESLQYQFFDRFEEQIGLGIWYDF